MEDDKEKTEIKKNVNNDVEQNFKWILVCENIAEVKKCELDKIFEIPIIEFLSIKMRLIYKPLIESFLERTDKVLKLLKTNT